MFNSSRYYNRQSTMQHASIPTSITVETHSFLKFSLPLPFQLTSTGMFAGNFCVCIRVCVCVCGCIDRYSYMYIHLYLHLHLHLHLHLPLPFLVHPHLYSNLCHNLHHLHQLVFWFLTSSLCTYVYVRIHMFVGTYIVTHVFSRLLKVSFTLDA